MKRANARHALGRAQLALLREALQAVPDEPLAPPFAPILVAEGTLRVRMPEGVVENPSHDAQRDTRRFRIEELKALRKQRLGLSDELRRRDVLALDQAQLPTGIRELEAREAVLEAALNAQFLPQHSPDQLISPNLFFTSPMFNVRSRAAKREALVELSLGRTGQGEVTYKGPEMRQKDGLVFMAMLNVIRDVQIGKRSSFEPQELCRALWGTYNGDARNRLRECIFRLQHAVVRFPSFSVQLVLRFEFPKQGRWSVVMDEDIVHLFKGSRLVWLDLAQRKALPEGLATWLFAYIESQTTLIPWPTEKLREMCGSDARPREFNTILARALTNLAAAGVVDSGWFFEDGLVHWRKTGPALPQVDRSSRPDLSAGTPQRKRC